MLLQDVVRVKTRSEPASSQHGRPLVRHLAQDTPFYSFVPCTVRCVLLSGYRHVFSHFFIHQTAFICNDCPDLAFCLSTWCLATESDDLCQRLSPIALRFSQGKDVLPFYSVSGGTGRNYNYPTQINAPAPKEGENITSLAEDISDVRLYPSS